MIVPSASSSQSGLPVSPKRREVSVTRSSDTVFPPPRPRRCRMARPRCTEHTPLKCLRYGNTAQSILKDLGGDLHGTYLACVGANLLGQTREPLIVPTDEERTGYVPNVVYSCGALLHRGMLIIPYALSDLSTSMARVDIDELLDSLVES